MPAPVLFIGFPLLMAPVLYLLRRTPAAASLTAVAVTGALALLALVLPLGQPVGWLRGVPIDSTATILGRVFEIAPDDRPALAFLFGQAAVLFLAAGTSATSDYFLPAGLANLGLLAAALFVRPFLFAAPFTVIGAALSVFMLAGDGQSGPLARQATRGALRFLVYITLSLPFILLTGWLLEASAASPADTSFTAQATVLLLLGFAVLMAVVPFHSWLPAVAEDSPAFAAAFSFSVTRLGILFLLLTFLNTYSWLGQNPAVFRALTLAGGGMALVGALFAFGQRNFGRVMGYLMIIDIGAVLLAIGLATPTGVQVALAILVLRSLALPLWAMGVDQLRRAAGSDEFEALRGYGRRYPLATAAVVVGMLSIAGFPLTAGFTARWALLNHLAPGQPAAAILLLLGTVSVSLVAARGLVALLARPATPDADEVEPVSVPALVLYGLGFATLLVLGLFPQWLLPTVANLSAVFTRLGQ